LPDSHQLKTAFGAIELRHFADPEKPYDGRQKVYLAPAFAALTFDKPCKRVEKEQAVRSRASKGQ
jgi:hypothetical protein